MKVAEDFSASPASRLYEPYRNGARLPFGIAAGSAFVVTCGAVVTPAQAQIYTSNLTASAANPTVYFSTATGVSSFASFTDATDQIKYTSVTGNASLAPIGASNNVAVYDCAASRYTAGTSIQSGMQFDSSNSSSGTTQYGNSSYDLDGKLGWLYPGSGFVGLRQTLTVNNVMGDYFGWASVNLNTDHSIKLNSFALQSTPGTDILAGAAPAVIAGAATPEPDAIALLALGASGLAALRLRCKASEAATAATTQGV